MTAPAEDQAVAVAAALHGVGPLARLAPAWRARVRGLVPEVRTVVDDERRRMAAGVPAGAAAIHPSWRAAPGAGPIGRWRARADEVDLVDMPVAPAPAEPRLADAPRIDGAALQAALETIGLGRLGLALRAVPRAAAERVARLLGARGPELLAALERPAERGEVSAAVRELVGLGEGALFAAGARHVAPALATLAPLAVRQMAQRLRRPLGETLLAEVRRAAPDARRAQVLLAALRGR